MYVCVFTHTKSLLYRNMLKCRTLKLHVFLFYCFLLSCFVTLKGKRKYRLNQSFPFTLSQNNNIKELAKNLRTFFNYCTKLSGVHQDFSE